MRGRRIASRATQARGFHRLHARARDGERGAVLVEAALILPFLITFLAGIIDFGFMYRHYLTVASATRSATRAVARAGPQPTADWEALQALLSARSNLPTNSIQYAVVYKSPDGPSGKVPTACRTASVVNVCNRYVNAGGVTNPFTMSSGTFTTTLSDAAWPARTRRAGTQGDADWVGVFVVTRFDYPTRVFGSSRMVSDSVVMREDPSTDNLSTVSTLPPPPKTTTTTTTTTLPTTTTTGPSTTTRPTTTTTTTRPPTTTTSPGGTTTTTRPTTTTTRPPTTTTTTAPTTTTTTRPSPITTTTRPGHG